VRLLLATHAALDQELGAAQVALNLAEALRHIGHDVTLWSPAPTTHATPWLWRGQRADLARFVVQEGPFDVVDAPANFLAPRIRATTIARSVQPELQYLAMEIHAAIQLRHPARTAAALVIGAARAWANVGGWQRARLILCQGTLERRWMERRFPIWKRKIDHYFVAPSRDVRERLRSVRRSRRGDGNRYLWLGRWAEHKGIERLLPFAHSLLAGGKHALTIAGCGDAALRDGRLRALEDSGLRVVPRFTRRELPALLADHDRGLFTSKIEGWGLSLNEMLESGLPVSATQAGAVPDLLPFWAPQLGPFPAPVTRAAMATEDRIAEYEAQFNWNRIATDYARTAARVAGSA